MPFSFSSGQGQSWDVSVGSKKEEVGKLTCKIRGKEEILVSMKFTILKVSMELLWAINKDSAQTCIGR